MHDHEHEHEFGADSEPTEVLDLNEVMQAFGIDEWRNLGPIDAHKSESLSMLIEAQGKQYILREQVEAPLDTDTKHFYRFQSYLEQEGIPIMPLRTTLTGEPMVAFGEDRFELQEKPQGEFFSSADPRNLDQVGAAGAMLARIHLLSQRYPGPRHRWPAEAQAGGLTQGWLNFARERAGVMELQAVAAGLSNWVDQWEALLPSAMMSIGASKNAPEFHIHGDYHAQNLLFGPRGITAVLGLNASRWERRLIELAYGLFYFSALEWRLDTQLTRPLVKRGLDPERARRFLGAYGTIFPPAPGEAARLSDAVALVAPIVTVNGPLEDVFFAQDEVDDAAVIDDVLERLAWASSLPAWLGRVRGSLADMWEKA